MFEPVGANCACGSYVFDMTRTSYDLHLKISADSPVN